MKRSFDDSMKMNIIVAVKNGMTATEAAKKCDVSIATASRYKNKVDSCKNISQIAKHYKVNYQKLCRMLREEKYTKDMENHVPNYSEEPRYTWSEVVEIIYRKYNILLGD